MNFEVVLPALYFNHPKFPKKTLLGDIEAPAVIIIKVAHWDVCISVLHVEHIWL